MAKAQYYLPVVSPGPLHRGDDPFGAAAKLSRAQNSSSLDGGSDDKTVPVLKKYSPWLAHWESQPDRGQSHALNNGFTRATGRTLQLDQFRAGNTKPGAFAAVAARYRPGPAQNCFSAIPMCARVTSRR